MDEKAGNSNKSKRSLEDMANSMTVESFFSTYVLLDIFLSEELINKAKEFHAQLNTRQAKEGILYGYKLLLIIAIDGYIDSVVRSPEIIGIEPDYDYRDYWAFTMGRGREITDAATRSNHYISTFVAKARKLIKDILKLKTWESIEDFSEKTKSFRKCLRQISEKSYDAKRNGRKVSIRRMLLATSNSLLWSIYGNPLPIAHKYTDNFTKKKKKELNPDHLERIVDESSPSSGITRLDSSHIGFSWYPRPIPKHWALGYVYSLHESLKLLARNKKQREHLMNLDDVVISIKNWNDIRKYDSKLTRVYGMPTLFSDCTYKLSQEITFEDRQPLTAEIEATYSPERLLSIFGNRARIVERGFPGAFNSFECLLDGALKRSKRTKEKAKVAIIVHKGYRGEEDYSVAIFMPAYGMLTNASMWWVFFSIGNAHSGGASHTWKQVWIKIRRNRKNIDLIVEEADEEEFYRYCEDPGYTRLNDAIVLTNKITSEVRGVFPELLLANMLTNMDYTIVRNRLKPKILKPVNGELDTVGMKLTGGSLEHIMLFESKGQALDENQLQQQINRFSDNVSTIVQNLESFCNELGVPYTDNIEIEAIFVSMDTLDDFKEGEEEESIGTSIFTFRNPNINVPDNVELWDYNKLVSKLREHQVPREYIELLIKTPVAIIIDPFPVRTPKPGTLASPNR